MLMISDGGLKGMMGEMLTFIKICCNQVMRGNNAILGKHT